jgi:hypothetical protein
MDLKSIDSNVVPVRVRPWVPLGELAQLGEHLPCKQEVSGSIPLFSTIWRLSSAGRASALQAEGRRFDPVSLHHVVLSLE